jgi:hypothetical protein
LPFFFIDLSDLTHTELPSSPHPGMVVGGAARLPDLPSPEQLRRIVPAVPN